VPVVTIQDTSTVLPLIAALRAGGLDCIEITFRHAGAPEAIRAARSAEGFLVGAGTILSVEQADAAAEAGADFAVAPGTNDDVIEACGRRNLPFFPGVATPSEIDRMRARGITTLKVFPAAQLGGPGFLRAVSATYPDVGFMPTGGITAENVGEYLRVPSVVACGGSWLVRPELIREGRFDEIERLARAVPDSVA
jgi:2-dehydro-3-deoxyphosphogluconate aldolase/(4S)-4-hydroxy-2-oxoglutarate aldolase